MFGGALMMVLGAIVAGNGYGWGTWKTRLHPGPVARPRRWPGRLVAMTMFVVGIVLVTLALYVGVSLLIATTESQAVVWPVAS